MAVRWSTRSCSTKTWNVIRFNLIKEAGLVVDAARGEFVTSDSALKQ